MNKLLVIICLEISMLNCSLIQKCNTNDNSMSYFGQIHELQVRNFSEIPNDLLENMDKMGIDASAILNEYEGKYFNFIFKIAPKDFNLVGKKIGFSRSKIDYFNWTRTNSTIVGGSGLYIFNAAQKVESGGYDAAIVYWSKFLLPVEEVIANLKRKGE